MFLRFSKCDQIGKGANVFVGRTREELCPVSAALAYMAIRGASPGPFFCNVQGTPLLKVRFVTELKKALTAIGVDQSQYAGHSFRIGAAMAGLEEATIRTLGRWKSDAFMLYIRMPSSRLADLTSTISGSSLGVCGGTHVPSLGGGVSQYTPSHPSAPSRGAGFPDIPQTVFSAAMLAIFSARSDCVPASK